MLKQTSHMKPPTHIQRTAIEEAHWNIKNKNYWESKPVLIARNLILNSDVAQNQQYMFGPH